MTHSRTTSRWLPRLAGAITFLTPLCTAAADAEAAGFKVVSASVIPATCREANDVRWASEGTVILAASTQGTFEVSLRGQAPPRLLVPGGQPPPHSLVPGAGPHSVWLAQLLGLSDDYLVVGAPAFQVAWMPRKGGNSWHEFAIDAVADLDVHGDRLLVLGWRRDKKGQPSPDGSIAWLARLDQDPLDLKPVLFAASGPGALTVGKWSITGAGKARFLADGSFLIVPGVEPGVYLYGPDGILRRTWDSRRLGIDLASAKSDELRDRAGRDPAARAAFVNARCLVDEILPLPGGPALVLRSVMKGKVKWRLAILKSNGGVDYLALPIDCDSPHWHVAGDVRGSKVILLLYEFSVRGPKEFASPRLVQLELAP